MARVLITKQSVPETIDAMALFGALVLSQLSQLVHEQFDPLLLEFLAECPKHALVDHGEFDEPFQMSLIAKQAY